MRITGIFLTFVAIVIAIMFVMLLLADGSRFAAGLGSALGLMLIHLGLIIPGFRQHFQGQKQSYWTCLGSYAKAKPVLGRSAQILFVVAYSIIIIAGVSAAFTRGNA